VKYNENDLRNEIKEALGELKSNVMDRIERLDIIMNILDKHSNIANIFNSYELYNGEYNAQVDEFYEKLKHYEKDGKVPQ